MINFDFNFPDEAEAGWLQIWLGKNKAGFELRFSAPEMIFIHYSNEPKEGRSQPLYLTAYIEVG